MDQILAGEQVTSLTQPGDVLLPLTNNVGTACDLAQYNPGTGTTTVVDHRVYDSFGNLVSQTNAAVDFLFGLAGRPTDPATGNVNDLNRWYQSSTGDWLSKDPTGFDAGDTNVYRYVGNSPTNASDPTGLAAPAPPGGIPSGVDYKSVDALISYIKGLTAEEAKAIRDRLKREAPDIFKKWVEAEKRAGGIRNFRKVSRRSQNGMRLAL